MHMLDAWHYCAAETKEGSREGRNQSKRPQTLNGYIQGWNGQATVDGAHGLTPSMGDQG